MDEILSLLRQDALVVAPQLLGWTLVHHSAVGDVGGVIVETEAYRARDDKASHAFGKLATARTAPMFMAGGAVYVYFTYGMHYCMNIVTGPEGEAQAVLLRALVPTIGLALMHSSRPAAISDHRLASGPANLCRSLGIGRELSGSRLNEGPIELTAPSTPLDQNQIVAGPRIGIRQAVDLPWRFWVIGSPSVSK